MKTAEQYYEEMVADKDRRDESAKLCSEKDDYETARILFVRVANFMKSNPPPELVVALIAVMVHDIRAGEALRLEPHSGHVVHVLVHGRALCGLISPPSGWPPGHVWVDMTEWEKATCAGCRARGNDMAGPPAP